METAVADAREAQWDLCMVTMSSETEEDATSEEETDHWDCETAVVPSVASAGVAL